MNDSGNNVRAASKLLKANSITMAEEPVAIGHAHTHGDGGKLTLKKENGIVKGFEYQCICGHKDHFICE